MCGCIIYVCRCIYIYICHKVCIYIYRYIYIYIYVTMPYVFCASFGGAPPKDTTHKYEKQPKCWKGQHKKTRFWGSPIGWD